MSSLILTIVLFLIGLVCIVKGGDWFVDAASWIAETFGIPKLIVGATVVSFATTLPELLVSALAAIDGKVDMAIGNAIGSVTANIGLIMAIGIFCMPSKIHRNNYLLKSCLMLGAAGYLVLFGFRGELPFLYSVVLLAIFVAAMIENYLGARAEMHAGNVAEEKHDRSEMRKNIFMFIIGVIGIVLGAQLLVDNGSELARIIGIPERIIGVTVVAIGTSLPELVTTITAIIKKESALSIGNIIGANIIDLSLILPVCAALSGGALPISQAVAAIDMPFCLLVGAVAVIPTLITERFHRSQGIALLLIYLLYLTITCGLIRL